jgi:O-antigen/teichoic acid export membrane protein
VLVVCPLASICPSDEVSGVIPNTSLLDRWAGIAGGPDAEADVRLARGAASSFVFKIVNSGLSFTGGLLLARWLGTAGYGAYAYAMAWIWFLVPGALIGLDTLLVREMAAYRVQSAWGEMRAFLLQAHRVVLCASIGLALGAAAVAQLFASRADPQVLVTLWVALLILPLMALSRVGLAILQGLHQVTRGLLPSFVVQPVIFVSFLLGAHWLAPKLVTASGAMKLNVASFAIAWMVLLRVLWRYFPESAKQAEPVHRELPWFKSVLPLLLFTGMYMVNGQADILLLGMIKGAREAGIYQVASRTAGLIGFFLVAVIPALLPEISSLYAARRMDRLQRVITRSVRLTLLASLPVGLALIIFGRWLLAHLFGADFAQAGNALAILSVGQLANVAMGSAYYMLLMMGLEVATAKGMAAGAVANIVLNATLIPKWGLEGAAFASAASMILWNIWLSVLAYKRLGVHSTALGRIWLASP